MSAPFGGLDVFDTSALAEQLQADLAGRTVVEVRNVGKQRVMIVFDTGSELEFGLDDDGQFMTRWSAGEPN